LNTAPLSYSIPVSPGEYDLDLHFAEIYFPQNETGARVFDVTVEGQLVLNDFDILAQTAGDINQPIVINLPNISPDTFGATDAIDISFSASANNAKISGIVILGGEESSVLDLIAPTATLSLPLADITSETDAPHLIQVEFTDDIDLDISSIDGNEIQVTNSLGNLLSVNLEQVDGNIATYGVTPPNGTWDNLDNDTYSVEILAGSVEDTANNAIASTLLGSFDVSLEVPPVITTPESITIAENQAFVVDIAATDSNGDTEGDGLSYSLTGGEDQDAFAINPDTGVLSFKSSPDFENPLDQGQDNTYEVEVTILDSTDLNDTLLMGVVISDVQETDDPSGNLIRLEAEDAEDRFNYRVENNTVASGGKILSFLGGGINESGSVTFGFDGVPGVYDINLATFDENDGTASFKVELNDFETTTTTEIALVNLDENLGSSLANSKTLITPTIAFGVDLTAGDTITINGLESGREHARIDYLEFAPVNNL